MAVELKLDHIVVSAARLEDGITYVETALGVKMAPGGKHPAMGTHNALLGLGDAYLEVIAIDPDAPAPGYPRWFDLDNFVGSPRLTNWVVKCTDLSAALALAPDGAGRPMALSRGDLHWTLAVSPEGTLPFDSGFPGFIDWGDTPHPATRLPDVGCRLQSVEVRHRQADGLRTALARFGGGLENWVGDVGPLGFRATVMTPGGTRVLA